MIDAFDRGEGEAVLMLHGAPSPRDDFRPMADALVAAGRRAIVADLPGYGRTPRLEPFSWDRTLEMLEELLTSRGVSRTTVVGFSSGGHLAIALAARGRIEVTGVLAIGAFLAMDDHGRAALKGFIELLRSEINPRDPQWGTIMVQRMLSADFAAARTEIREQVASWLTLTSPLVLADELEEATKRDLRVAAAAVTAPVIAAMGELDVACPPAFSHEIARVVPNARVEIRKGRGHALLLEDPAWCIEAALSLTR